MPEAKQGAKEWHNVASALRDRFNRAGGDVGQLEDWGLPHHHSQSKVAKAGREQWVADTLPALDRDHYFNPDGTRMNDTQLSEFLGHAWESIATGGANKTEPGAFRGSGARANRGNESRQIHFKGADAYMDYQGKYGEKSLYEVLVGHIESVSKDTALVETLGPNPDSTYRLFRDTAVLAGKRADPTQYGKLDERAVKSDNLYNVVSGKTQPVASKWLSDSFDTLRNWLIAARLGSSVITSFSDEATLHLTAKVNQLPEMRLLANELAAYNRFNKMEERLALRAGLAMQTLVSSLNRFGQQGLGRAFSSKLANSVLRASGLNAMTEARKRAFGVTMMHALGSVVKEHGSLGELDANDHRILLSKGLTENDFAVWKKAQLEDWGGGNDTMLTPESIYRIPDSAIDQVIQPKLDQIKVATQGQIDELHSRDAEEQQWLSKRAANLKDWVQSAQDRLATRIANTEGRAKERLQGLSQRLASTYGQLDTASAFWKDTRDNQISLRDLYHAGVKAGKGEARASQANADIKSAARDVQKLRGELEKNFEIRWHSREKDLLDRIASGRLEGHALSDAMGRFEKQFTEANARITDRLQHVDQQSAQHISGLQEKLGEAMGRMQAGQSLYEIAQEANPALGALREQGAREGRAQKDAQSLQERMRQVGAEFGQLKQEAGLDLAEAWGKRLNELQEFQQRIADRATRRQQVVDRIERSIQPATEAARKNAREQAATKLLAHVLEETDVAVIEPGAKERSFTGAGLQRGTWKGELTRSFFLFKSFPLAMITRHWARGMSLPNTGSRAAYLATLFAATTVLGVASLETNEVLMGRDPKSMNPFDKGGVRNWISAMLKGGSLGIYGDFLFSDSTQYGNSPIATITGPVLGLAEDVFNLTQGNIVQTLQGKPANVGAETTRFVKGNTPGASLWYAKAALDHLVYNQLSEYFSPGYLARMRSRVQNEFQQKYYWEPQDVLPSRAPDLSAAVSH